MKKFLARGMFAFLIIGAILLPESMIAAHNDEFKDKKINKYKIINLLEKKIIEVHLRMKEYEVDGKITEDNIDYNYFYLYGKYIGLDEAIFTVKCI